MSASDLSSRAIIGWFYERLEQNPGLEWVNAIGMKFNSDQDSETYKWLGQVPQMREWIGGRQPKGFRSNGITIANKHFESTLEIMVKEMRRDKTGQLRVRVNEQADRANDHWAKLVSDLILAAETTVCYDNQYFFDTDHSEANSGTQSNKINITISGLPASVHGSTTQPSTEEMQLCILKTVQQMLGFKDDQGEPINQSARDFLVMVPTPLWFVAEAAVSVPVVNGGASNITKVLDRVNLSVAQNPRLTWTDKFAVFRTDGSMKPIILQEETTVQMKAMAEGSPLEFTDDKHQYGIDAWRNVGYGLWQQACQARLV